MKYLRVILIVLLLMCCTLWVASYWEITWVSSDGLLFLNFWTGSLQIGLVDVDSSPGHYGLSIDGYRDLNTYWWPVGWIYFDPGMWLFVGAFWFPTLLLALPLAISASPWARRRRRAKQGLCIRCGYDLSGTDHTLCPECGKEIRKANHA